MNTREICICCMKGKINENGVCPVCNTNNNEMESNSRHLPFRFILKGKYLIGKVIGEGGFGITYVGFDLDLETRVAIKEFFPRRMVGREIEEGYTVRPFAGEEEVLFEKEREKFIDEARRLARFRNEKNVVSVLDYFRENGTAYIVMDYIEGTTLRKYVKARDEAGKHMGMKECLELLNPLMETLDKIHSEQLIHRDISPDNIMIDQKKKEAYLIDFGTARDMEEEHSKSVYMKGSFTPIEQMSRHGHQGPWTDVYELCATIYWSISGHDIPDAIERMGSDNLVKPSAYGVKMPAYAEAALIKGLSVHPEDRIQSVKDLIQLLNTAPVEVNVKKENVSVSAPAIKEESKKRDLQEFDGFVPLYKEDKKKKYTPFIVIIGIIVAVAAIMLGTYLNDQYRNRTEKSQEANGGYSYSYYEDGKLVRKLQYTSDDSILLEEEYDTAGNYSLSKYFYDESEKYIGREDYYNNQIIYKFELRNNIIFHYTYESSDTFYVVGTNPETVEEGWFKSGEWETYIFYDFPKDGWYSKSEYVLGDGNNNNHTTYFYDETGSLVYEMVIVNEEKVSEMVHNQEKYSSINWDEY